MKKPLFPARKPSAGARPGRAGECPSSRLGLTGRLSSTFSLQLARLHEPLLICRGLLPPLVGRTGADQVHVGAEVLAVLAGLVAGAVGAEAEVVGRDDVGVRREVRGVGAVPGEVGAELRPLRAPVAEGSDAPQPAPRLARGEEVPCFALTSLDAGSDAAASLCLMQYGTACPAERRRSRNALACAARRPRPGRPRRAFCSGFSSRSSHSPAAAGGNQIPHLAPLPGYLTVPFAVAIDEIS